MPKDKYHPVFFYFPMRGGRLATLCVLEVDYEPVSIGITIKCPWDRDNRKLARQIAIGRAFQNIKNSDKDKVMKLLEGFYLTLKNELGRIESEATEWIKRIKDVKSMFEKFGNYIDWQDK